MLYYSIVLEPTAYCRPSVPSMSSVAYNYLEIVYIVWRYTMPRVLVSLLMIGAVLALALRVQAQSPGPNPLYVPLLRLPEAAPTATATATATTIQPTPTSPTATPVTPTATNTTIPATPTRDPAVCAPEYPTVCIPPPPPDLDCGDIPYRRFTVLPPDRHRFDSDNNGIGCESG
jgi:hypothetical protein